jgi:hypothetical protein
MSNPMSHREMRIAKRASFKHPEKAERAGVIPAPIKTSTSTEPPARAASDFSEVSSAVTKASVVILLAATH